MNKGHRGEGHFYLPQGLTVPEQGWPRGDSRYARGPRNGAEVGGWVGAQSGAGVEMTETAGRRVPGTHPSGRREHAAGGASEAWDRRRPRAARKTGGRARAGF